MSETKHVIIAETYNFAVKVPNLPHIPRDEGGHIFVETKNGYENRWEFTEEEAIEQAWLTQLAAQAYWEVMEEELELYKLNLQDNGNWAFVDGDRRPLFHVHIYGRSNREKLEDAQQEYGQALMFPWRDTGYYDDFDALSKQDVARVAHHMEELASSAAYDWDATDANRNGFVATGK